MEICLEWGLYFVSDEKFFVYDLGYYFFYIYLLGKLNL